MTHQCVSKKKKKIDTSKYNINKFIIIFLKKIVFGN